MTDDAQADNAAELQAVAVDSQAESKPAKRQQKFNRGQWLPGQSGNPGGRVGAQKLRHKLDIQQLAQAHTKTAMKALVDIVKDKDAPHSARAQAAGTLLDRGWGKAPQTITHKGELENGILAMITALSDEKPQETAEDSEKASDRPLH